jgi:hypothetical protein
MRALIMPGGKPHPVDRSLQHLEEVVFGGATLVAHLPLDQPYPDVAKQMNVEVENPKSSALR